MRQPRLMRRMSKLVGGRPAIAVQDAGVLGEHPRRLREAGPVFNRTGRRARTCAHKAASVGCA
jgi:hypothetical protein